MNRLNVDIESGLVDRPSSSTEEQTHLLESQPQENRENTIEELQNTFQYSKVYNLIIFLIPSAKFLISLIVLIFGEYKCIGNKHIWLMCMMLHDALHAFIIILRLDIIFSLNRLNSVGNSEWSRNNHSQNPIHQEIQLSERSGVLIPQEQNEEEINSEDHNYQQYNLNNERSTHTLQIVTKRQRVAKFTTLCTYIWMLLFLFWLEMDAIHENGICDSKQINDIVYLYLIIGWMWLMNPLFICITACLCLPVLVLIIWIFRKPQQTPATQNEINNIPVKLYSSEIPGNKECVICMVEYQDEERILQLDCSPMHHFHEECVKNWLKINGQCPTCRARIGHSR